MTDNERIRLRFTLEDEGTELVPDYAADGGKRLKLLLIENEIGHVTEWSKYDGHIAEVVKNGIYKSNGDTEGDALVAATLAMIESKENMNGNYGIAD